MTEQNVTTLTCGHIRNLETITPPEKEADRCAVCLRDDDLIAEGKEPNNLGRRQELGLETPGYPGLDLEEDPNRD